MHVWIDLANSPHPVLFGPLTDALEARGHTVSVTARDHAQTLTLTRERWPDAHVVAGTSPPTMVAKAAAIGKRVLALRAAGSEIAPDVAVSHNSYAQVVAARSMGIPAMTAMDFEYQPANHVAFRAARLVVVPEVFPRRMLRQQGATARKVRTYTGFKEEAYLHGFKADPAVADRLGLGADEAYVVARPSPRGATYHQHGNRLFARAVERAARYCRVVLLPRRADDIDEFASNVRDRLLVPERAVDGRSLVARCSAVIGAGGTMNREAALLGAPVFSLFAGRLAAVDQALLGQGRMHHLRDELALDMIDAALDGAVLPGTRGSAVGPGVRDRFIALIEEAGGMAAADRR